MSLCFIVCRLVETKEMRLDVTDKVSVFLCIVNWELYFVLCEWGGVCYVLSVVVEREDVFLNWN